MATMDIANIGGRGVSAWKVNATAQQIEDAILNASKSVGVRPNLILNHSLKVNQRGQTTYTSPSSATSFLSMLDGVSGKSATVTIENDGISFSVSKDTHVGRIRFLIPDGYISNKVYQVSVLADITEAGPNTKIHIANHRTAITAGAALSISGPTNKKALFTFEWSYSAESSDPMSLEILAFEGTISGKIYGVKFEEGETQTLAYQDSNGDWQLLPQPDSSYTAQLLECQRYYSKSSQNIDGFSGGFLAETQPGSTEWLTISARFPVSMVNVPTVTVPWISKATNISQNLVVEGVIVQPNAVSESGFNLLNVQGLTLESGAIYLVQFSSDASL